MVTIAKVAVVSADSPSTEGRRGQIDFIDKVRRKADTIDEAMPAGLKPWDWAKIAHIIKSLIYTVKREGDEQQK